MHYVVLLSSAWVMGTKGDNLENIHKRTTSCCNMAEVYNSQNLAKDHSNGGKMKVLISIRLYSS